MLLSQSARPSTPNLPQAIAARDAALSAWNGAAASLLAKRDRLERAKEEKAAALRAEVPQHALTVAHT